MDYRKEIINLITKTKDETILEFIYSFVRAVVSETDAVNKLIESLK